MHGGKSPGAPRGERHPNFKTGKYTKEAREVSRFFIEMAKDAETLLAVTLDAAGLGRKIPAVYRRRTHVKKARAAAAAAKKAKEKTE